MIRGGFHQTGFSKRDLVTGTRLRRLRRLAVFDPAFVAQVATFLSLLLALGGLAAFVHLFFDEPGAFLHFAFNAHDDLPCWRWGNSRRELTVPVHARL